MKCSIFGWLIWMICVANIASAQDSLTNPIFKLHNQFTKSSDVTSTTQMSLNNQNYNYSINAHFESGYEIVDVLDSGLYDIKFSLNVINTEVSTNGVKMRFDSQNDSLNTDSIIAKPLSDILGKSFHFIVNKNGYIVTADTSILLKKANTYMANTLLNGYGMKAGDKLDILFDDLDSISDVGKQWVDTLNAPDGQRITNYTVEKIFNQNVLLNQIGTLNKILQIEKESFRTNALFEGNFSGKVNLYKNTGLITERTMDIQMNSSIEVGETKIPTTSHTVLKETIHQ